MLIENYTREHGVEPSRKAMAYLSGKAMAMAMEVAPIVDDDVKIQNYAMRTNSLAKTSAL
jgi:hypothetical protein